MSEVKIPQGTIRYRESGEGPPIVFVHGLLVDGRLWRKVTPLLEDRYRCIVPDLPLGSHLIPMNPDADLSPPGLARIVAGFLEALDLDGVTLVGNDTGGAISQITAANHPERIGRLVLTNCDAFENFLPPAFRPLQWAARVPGLLTGVLQGMRLDAAAQRLPIAYGWLIKRDLDDAPLASGSSPFLSDRGDPPGHRQGPARGSTRATRSRRPRSCGASTGRRCSPGPSRTASSSSPSPSGSPRRSAARPSRGSRTPTPSSPRTSPSGSPS